MTAATPRADGWTFECKVHFSSAAKGRRRLREGDVPPPAPVEPGSIPRAARLVALAHRFEGLLASGVAKDYADLARLAGVTRARISQIASLALLAPDIQEAVLDLPRTLRGRDALLEADVRAIALVPEWSKQRALWRGLTTGGKST
jgi:hypothetical protein